MKPFRILLIDDDAEQVEILKMILSEPGRDIQTCTQAREALALIEETHFDLVFTDISMPEVDGVQVLKHIKEHSPATQVVPITAFGDWGIYAEAMRLGASDFLNKPYDIPELQGMVDRIAATTSY